VFIYSDRVSYSLHVSCLHVDVNHRDFLGTTVNTGLLQFISDIPCTMLDLLQ
jgi:hypothetical protein